MISGPKKNYVICRVSGVLSLLAMTAVALIGSGARAASLVADGGFEAAGGGNVYYAGQSVDGGAWTVTKGAVYIDTQDPYVFNGSNSLNLTYANLYAPNVLSQVLATVIGQSYQLNFWGNADTANTFAITENGVTVGGLPGSIANKGFPGVTNSVLFTDYTAGFVATSASTTLSLMATASPGIGSPNGSVMIDDLSLQATAAATPEPGSLVLVMTGLTGVGEVVRRRRLNRRFATR